MASWNYNVNITSENRKKQQDAYLLAAEQTKDAWREISTRFKSWRNYKDHELVRIIEKAIDISSSALSDEDLKLVST